MVMSLEVSWAMFSSSKSGIPAELKDYYLEKGYSLDDRVGTSNLEYQYEDIFKR